MDETQPIVAQLNALLSIEMTAINQYIVHSKLCEKWGYAKLHDLIRRRALTEMKHAERLIEHILFLDGLPVVDKLKEIRIGEDIVKQFENDIAVEGLTIKMYKNAIKITEQANHLATAEMLRFILADQETHYDWLEFQLTLIKQVPLKDYLEEQIKAINA